MTTRTTALATQQQLRSAGPGSAAWRLAASKSAAAPSPFLADGCRDLVFMPSASPGPGRAGRDVGRFTACLKSSAPG